MISAILWKNEVNEEEGTYTYCGCQVVALDVMASLRSAVATESLPLDSLASSVVVDHPALSREANKPPGDSEDQNDDVQGK